MSFLGRSSASSAMQSVSGKIAFVADLRAFGSDADTEVAKILVAVGLQRRFAEDLPQHLAGDLVAFPWLGFQVPRRSVSQFFSWAVCSFQPSSVLRMNCAVCSLLDRRLHLG